MSNARHRILIVGGGGREHALAWKLAASPRVDHVYVAPGNAGTATMADVSNVAIGVDELDALRDFALDNAVSLTVVGPEAPLAIGIVDVFEAAGLACFGPKQAAAELEASKAFSKDFLARHAIPTAEYATFADYDAAAAYIESRGAPIVIKADGLAAGKGVTLAHTVDEALASARDMLEDNAFGDAGARIVVEEFLVGEEASFIAMVDGEHILPLASSQDHKAAYDGDTGPNTGGMGAYSPAPVVTDDIAQRVMNEVMRPTVAGLADDGRPFSGFLYAGLMIDEHGAPRVLEFNVRMGDPETQPIMMRLESDLVDLLEAAIAGRLDTVEARWREDVALGVVMAAGGYPGAYAKGDVIEGLDRAVAEDVEVFHAGTALDDEGRVVTSGGRVLCVCALGRDVSEAQEKAYRGVAGIQWPNVSYRRDIGHRAINRDNPAR
ncbi:phosphoribosylamine--glycine ligase [Salinisphaera hydrothermalis]|uniref:Phosphoribosylamine--glycine ligase n=1 Tax=Salinisphaera hydrothermalis (strain C41B8) TaxID=1304275 RepID=A0A084IIE2_SALHC|nr:phosphoribosylamine--glycine ligase [Salinisphaera hydrothermalis]KEZ76476.1 phosphoribosylamine--glycine ligase [Salinisphaera hydrothermalis C41B8]